MDISQLAELGGMVVIVALFLWHIQKKDKQSIKKDEQFGQIISNHINHNTESSTKLADTIAELLRFLKNGNGRK